MLCEVTSAAELSLLDAAWVQAAWEAVDWGVRRRRQVRRGMVLPFQPVTLTFTDVHYYVDLPRVSKNMFAVQEHKHLWSALV